MTGAKSLRSLAQPLLRVLAASVLDIGLGHADDGETLGESLPVGR